MKQEEMENLINGIQEKAGEEVSALISDDLGMLLTDNTNMNKEINKKDKEIEKLKNQKEKLIETNGNLLQQISMGEEEENFFNRNKINDDKKDETKKFSFKDAFDEKGKFKK